MKEVRKRLSRRMAKTLGDYGLVAPGDRIALALSGGKDSYAMVDLMHHLQRKAPVRFSLVVIHLDQGQPGYDGRALASWLEAASMEHRILREDTYSTVMRVSRPGATLCAPCSRLRRGILYGAAAELGCNKLALGHHRDDALETLLLNLFYTGRMQAMPAKYTTDDGRFEVIRPLIECAEDDLLAHAQQADYPILPCNLCGSQEGLKRQQIKALLTTLETDIPQLRHSMLAALKNVRTSHLLDLQARRSCSDTAARQSQGEPAPTTATVAHDSGDGAEDRSQAAIATAHRPIGDRKSHQVAGNGVFFPKKRSLPLLR